MWHDMATNSLTFLCDSHSHRTQDYVERWIHLKVTLNSNVLQVANKLNKIIKIVLFVTFDVLEVF